MTIDDILRREGLQGPAARLPLQGVATVAWATSRYVVKIAHEAHRDEVYTEALVAPLARAVAVRTPALVAWAREPELAYSIWERVDGEPLDERSDAAVWRAVGRELAKLHAIDQVDDPRGLLRKPRKRDARLHLSALPAARAAYFDRWLERLERVPAAPPRLTHNDVHGLNVLCSGELTTLIDWADAAWFDPAYEFGSIPMHHVEDALAGYEERASLGAGGEARILTTVIGYAVRKASHWATPMDDLERWLAAGATARFHDWLPR